jgi:hypothetical protein
MIKNEKLLAWKDAKSLPSHICADVIWVDLEGNEHRASWKSPAYFDGAFNFTKEVSKWRYDEEGDETPYYQYLSNRTFNKDNKILKRAEKNIEKWNKKSK